MPSSINNEVSSVNDPKLWTEFTGPGSVSRVFREYNRSELNASGEKPVFITPEVVQKKKKNPLSAF